MKNIIFARSRGVQKIFLDGFYRNGQGARTNTCNNYNYGSRSPPSDFFPFPYFFGLPREKKYKKNLREIFLSKDSPHPKKTGEYFYNPFMYILLDSIRRKNQKNPYLQSFFFCIHHCSSPSFFR